VRALAVFVGWLSLGQLLSALVLLGPHSDVPGRPASNGLVLALALAGFALARALWRRRPSAARALPLWAAGVALWAVGLALSVASPAEWRAEVGPALATALPVWAVGAWLATRYVRRRAGAAA
jgi:hypothetical protein